MFGEVVLLQVSARVVEGAELDRDACADADQRGESAFVESERPFVREDLSTAVKRGAVLVRRLEPDFDDICFGLARRSVGK